MRFSGVIATLFAATALAAPVENAANEQQQKAAMIIKQYVPTLEALFAEHPEVSAKLATQFPQFAENGAINIKALEAPPPGLLRDGIDLLLAVPRAVADVGLDILGAGLSAADWARDKIGDGISAAAGIGRDLIGIAIDIPRSIAGALIPWI